MTPIHVAFAGYAGSGKDTAALRLIERGFKRVCFGDIIKRQIDPLIQQHLGFSAFTEDREQKTLIRGVLEQWGDANYEKIGEEFFRDLPPLAVNTRLVRVREAEKWVAVGGVILLVQRPGLEPASTWEKDRLDELIAWGRSSPRCTGVWNGSTPEHLHIMVDNLVLSLFPHYATLPIVPPVPADEVVRKFMEDPSPCGLRTDGEWAGSDRHGVSSGTDL
jgi:hypothetical protein